MALSAPPFTSSPSLICDWIELKVLTTSHGKFRLGSLKRLWDKSREIEESDPEGVLIREEYTDSSGVSGPDDEVFMDSITGEIGERIEALGAAYPFEIDSRNRLCVIEPASSGGFVYLFCLLLTYSNGRELLDGSWLPRVDNHVRDLFQACSTVAAAGEVRGHAISFGWPRPNHNPPFLQRLREVYRLFGEGIVVDRPAPGVSNFPKDEEIDVIAWRPRRDRTAGTEYMLGQVASGDNWMGKPLAGRPIANFHRNWFTRCPASVAKGYIFIPHAVPPIDSLGTRRERIDAITVRYGTIIDRLRLPALTDEGVQFSMTESAVQVERQANLPEIREWVIEQINSLKAATA
ncbi:hypothetical protein [Variovorax rhizosphaerae]|uniref:DUF3396 domain-containing protein n=1 Tax=Variovorax rhizosphaerae TaxID=1836200 RepID=A0ABU8WDU4_9BURK